MCGLVGLIRLSGQALDSPRRVEAMASALAHRGPDDARCHVASEVALGFRRLSIIDLDGGAQPLANSTGTIWGMVNGELYDFVERRAELEGLGHRFSTRGDAEVAVHAYERWGLGFAERLRGMFAVAVWDATRRRLVLVRDRIGQKPLYYAHDPASGELAFASELRALRVWLHHGRLDGGRLDAEALDDFLTFLQVPGPRSAISGVRCLPPGHLMVATVGEALPEPRPYWHPDPTPAAAPAGGWQSALREVISESVSLRLRGDVPIGAFLSGGVDSTLIAGLASARTTEPLDTFCMGFADARFDERADARETAERFGTRHHESSFDVGAIEPEDLIDHVWAMDAPFADSSFLPTHHLSQWARRRVKVALSGDGGDELFAGYRRYRTFRQLERLAMAPSPLLFVAEAVTSRLAGGLRRMPIGGARRFAELSRQLAKACRLGRLSETHRLLGLLTHFDRVDKDRLYTDGWRAKLRETAEARFERRLAGLPATADPLGRALLRDLRTNLVDDGLVKVDRASMACGLEVRSPLLDHHVVELALRMPSNLKLTSSGGKAILFETFPNLLPDSVRQRPKRGFELPFAAWFRRPAWRDLLVDTLAPERIQRQGIFDPVVVVDLRDRLLDDPEAHRQPISAYQLRHRVWMLLTFQIWHERFFSIDPTRSSG